MPRLILVCGPTGAGKTSHALALCRDIGAIRFSIDPWMQTLFANDMTSLDYAWMMERVERCYEQIWEVAAQILQQGGNVVLDLGFTSKAQRSLFVARAEGLAVEAEVHYLSAPAHIRSQRVKQRNEEKDPTVYAFEVTDEMFNFMEPRFEVPDASELANGRQIDG